MQRRFVLRPLASVSVLALTYACGAPAPSASAPVDDTHASETHQHAEPEPAPASPREAAPNSASSSAAASHALTRIGDHAGVCMLSNRYLGERADVPIQVEGKTYRGCCANCAARLGSHPEARVAHDPVTGREVDKGSAVLARDAQNRVYYFESEETLSQFSAR